MGGIEGASECVWLKDDPSTGELIKICGTEAQLQYTVVPEDLGHMLVLAYTPVRSDGQTGEMVEIVTGEFISLGAVLAQKLRQRHTTACESQRVCARH